MPGIITSSSTMSGGSPCFTDGEHLVAARIGARLVAAKREKRAQVVRKGGIVIDDGDVGFLQRFNSAGGTR